MRKASIFFFGVNELFHEKTKKRMIVLHIFGVMSLSCVLLCVINICVEMMVCSGVEEVGCFELK